MKNPRSYFIELWADTDRNEPEPQTKTNRWRVTIWRASIEPDIGPFADVDGPYHDVATHIGLREARRIASETKRALKERGAIVYGAENLNKSAPPSIDDAEWRWERDVIVFPDPMGGAR